MEHKELSVETVLNVEFLRTVEYFAGKSGRTGASLSLKFLKTIGYNCTVIYKGFREGAIKNASQAIINSVGYIKMIDGFGDSGTPVLSAVIVSGIKNMNPALVFVTFECTEGLVIRIHINAFAKEGIINQKTAETAALRISDGLERLNGSNFLYKTKRQRSVY